MLSEGEEGLLKVRGLQIGVCTTILMGVEVVTQAHITSTELQGPLPLYSMSNVRRKVSNETWAE